MSGMVGIVNFDGAPIDRPLLSRMTAALDFRGPDARRTWIAEPAHESGSHPCVGFGHTLLRTTYEAEHEQQPFTLDGNTWIVADCRVDAREELLAKLRAKGRDASLDRPDVELILHAWHVWGEECVEHLLGDFAFAIWDAPRRRLFCARDHMGVKPFYYAHIGSTLIFSNTLDCVRMHPAVSDTLNDLAIADFILFGSNQESATTNFSDIQCLPAARVLVSACGSLRVSRYWTFPIEEPVYYRRDRDYTDRFGELLRESVSDRLRTPRVNVLMSGGLDSPALAATAVELLGGSSIEDPVHALTEGYDWLIPDSERHYAAMAADHLKIPLHYLQKDKKAEWSVSNTPYPNLYSDDPVEECQFFSAASARSRVALYGEGPDNALTFEWQSQLHCLASQGHWIRFASDVAKHIVHHKRVPLLPTIPRMLRQWPRRRRLYYQDFPEWLNPDLVSRLNLRQRSSDDAALPASRHPFKPIAYGNFSSSVWQTLFEDLDLTYGQVRLELRHPFVDLRLLRFMLQVPSLPWCRTKHLERRFLRDKLPPAIVNRPKTPLQAHPLYELAGQRGLPPVSRSLEYDKYCVRDRLPTERPANVVSFHVFYRFAWLSHYLSRQMADRMLYDEGKHEPELTACTRTG